MKFDLNAIVPNPNVRKWIYAIYAVAALLVGAIGNAYQSVALASPQWLIQTESVIGYLSVAVVGLAVANIPKKEKVEETPETIAKRIQGE